MTGRQSPIVVTGLTVLIGLHALAPHAALAKPNLQWLKNIINKTNKKDELKKNSVEEPKYLPHQLGLASSLQNTKTNEIHNGTNTNIEMPLEFVDPTKATTDEVRTKKRTKPSGQVLQEHWNKVELMQFAMDKYKLREGQGQLDNWSERHKQFVKKLVKLREDFDAKSVFLTDEEKRLWYDLENVYADVMFGNEESPPIVTKDGHEVIVPRNTFLPSDIANALAPIKEHVRIGKAPPNRQWLHLAWAAIRVGDVALAQMLLAKQSPYSLTNSEGKELPYHELASKMVALGNAIKTVREAAYRLSLMRRWQSYLAQKHFFPSSSALTSAFTDKKNRLGKKLDRLEKAVTDFYRLRDQISKSPIRKPGFDASFPFLGSRADAVKMVQDFFLNNTEADATAVLAYMLLYRHRATEAMQLADAGVNIKNTASILTRDKELTEKVQQLRSIRDALKRHLDGSNNDEYAMAIIENGQAFENQLLEN